MINYDSAYFGIFQIYQNKAGMESSGMIYALYQSLRKDQYGFESTFQRNLSDMIVSYCQNCSSQEIE